MSQLEDDEQHRRQRQQYGFEVDRRELQQMVADKSVRGVNGMIVDASES